MVTEMRATVPPPIPQDVPEHGKLQLMACRKASINRCIFAAVGEDA